MGNSDRYPGFDYAATELSAYTISMGIFIISLKNRQVIDFTPDDAHAFEQWLVQHRIRDIRKDKGTKHP